MRLSVCLEQGQQASRALTVCGEVLKSDPENVNALKDRAEAYVQEEQYEEGKAEGSWSSPSLWVSQFWKTISL